MVIKEHGVSLFALSVLRIPEDQLLLPALAL